MALRSGPDTLGARVRSFFDGDEWPLEESSEGLLTRFDGDNGCWSVVVLTREDQGTVAVLSVAPLSAGENSLAAMETVVRANFGMTIGAFDLDLDSGSIQFRTALDVHGQLEALTPGVIRHLVYQNVITMDRYLPAFRAVIEDGTDPGDALAEVE